MTERRVKTRSQAELHVRVDGDGEPLLLLHGLTGTGGDWEHSGLGRFRARYRTIAPDARGHGLSTAPSGGLAHAECAQDFWDVVDELGVGRFRAIGMSYGANALLHMATAKPERIEAMVLVSGAARFLDQARALMRQAGPEKQDEAAWATMRARHPQGDAQIVRLWEQQAAFADDTNDQDFSADDLARVQARTLVVHGDRDPLYPLETALELYRGVPDAQLWVVPGGGHGPIYLEAAERFADEALAFFDG